MADGELEEVQPRLPATDGFRPPPGVPLGRSSYLGYLPGMYDGSDFLGRFLLIFEHIFSPVQRTVANAPFYFDPAVTPPEVLEWLGSWLGLVVDERWPERTRRDLIGNAAALFAWRGTKRGLVEFLRLYTGVAPEISEPTREELAANPSRAFTFDIGLRLQDPDSVDEQLLREVIELEKPAWAAYTLTIVPDEG